MNVLVWFKRDLRIHDHPALVEAARLGAVLPVYIVEPDYWARPDASARQWAFVAESLHGLRDDLADIGAPLVVRVGDAVAVLDRLCRANRVKTLLSHQETGNLWTYARDRRVADWARQAGVDWRERPQSGVVRGLAGHDSRAAQADAFMTAPIAPVPVLRAVPGVEPGVIPSARALRLPEDRCPNRQAGGRVQGMVLLDSFLTQRGERYRSSLSSPVTGERACSRLSPHLAWGTLSGREVAQATAARIAERPRGHWAGALASFEARLAWRDHLGQKIEDDPDIEIRALDRATEGLRPRGGEAGRLAAWERGETGVPFLDACLRSLIATGWLNFRARAMVVAVASHQFWLDWRDTGPVLARRFTDYDPGIHWPQMQMQSGVTGCDAIRICNPVRQGLDHDPTGSFTRRWLPELAPVPDRFLQEPWKWPGARGLLGRRYPEPLVDLASARRAARDALRGLPRVPGAVAELAEVIETHGRPGGGRFVNTRSPRRRTAPAPKAQLVLDL